MNSLPLNLLTFPLWWYTTGVRLFWQKIKMEYLYGLQSTGLLVFARHLSEPLYGDYTRSGMVLSFFLRIFLLIYKLLMFSIRMLITMVLFLIYLIFLPVVTVMIIIQLMPTR